MVFDNWIGGEWCGSDERLANINPSDTRDVIGQYACATAAQVAAALDAATAAQPQWQTVGIEKRLAVLNNIGSELQARSGELGELLSREEGKPRAEGVGEVFRAGQFFTYFGAETLRQMGQTADSVRAGIDITTYREPMGVVAVISPWNFPMATAAWKIAPALAFGNAVVWKPASLTPASACALAEIISKQELPAGAFNLLIGSGGTVGDALAGDARVQAVTFTGSLAVGREVAKRAAQNLTKFQLEMGSKNALLVADDADLDAAVTAAAGGAFGGSGQKCTASSRLVVHAAVYDAFAERLLAATRQIKVGHALAGGTQMGPVVSEEQLQSNLQYLALAKKEGCELLCGGERLQNTATPGFYQAPALLTGNNAMQINREEMFAPIACLIKVESYDEGVAVVNDTDYGLVAGVITRSLARAADFRRRAQSGCVMVNLPTAGTDYHVPFGGRKNSSFGPREQGPAAVEFYTQVKTVYQHPGTPA